MKEFIISTLSETHIGANKPIKSIIGYLEGPNDDYLVDLPWFKHFPDKIQMRYILDVYNRIDSSLA